ncbi:helix-turn-helix domain-containing protein [Serratia fonticola]|uniref:helix-turn-helix domain-containing protein n=1 Tax=Serratia fonticola TaxID=47917 RepID=UPI003AFFD4FF
MILTLNYSLKTVGYMEKKELKENKQKVSFQEPGKETFKDRLKALIGERSVRDAAEAWGLSYSTLNNYLNRDTVPGLNVAQYIAQCEGVDLEWLATGLGSVRAKPAHSAPVADTKTDELKRDWIRIYDRMTIKQREAVLDHIALNGIKAILPGNVQTTESNSLNDSELIEIEDNLLKHGVNRTTAKVIMMALNLPSEEVREIFEAAAASARLKSSQASAIHGQEKKA